MLQYDIPISAENNFKGFLGKLLAMLNKHSDYLLAGIIFIIASIPLLKMGFSGDDILNTVIKGAILNSHTSFFEFTKNEIIRWIHVGRLFPMAFILLNIFSYVADNNLIFYNSLHWSIVVISYGLTCIFLKKLDFSRSHLLFFFSLLPCCWSLYPGSPLVSFAVLLPSLVIFMMLVFINYINFLETKRLRYGLYSAIFALLAFLTYEISLLIIPIVLLLNKYFTGKFFIRNKATYLLFAVTCLYLAVTLLCRHLFVISYPGIAVGHLTNLPATFLKQLSSELPLLYFYLYIKHYHGLHWITYSLASLLAICSFIMSYRLLNKKMFNIRQAKYIFLLSALLQLMPAFMIGISEKYQTASQFGSGHIPVFIQQIGFTLMLLVLFQWLAALPKLSYQVLVKIILSSLISVTMGLSFLTNYSIINSWNRGYQLPREIYQQALNQGLFKALPQNTIILRPGFSGGEDAWNNLNLLRLLIDRNDIYTYDFLNNALPLLEQSYHKEVETDLSNPSFHNIYYSELKNISSAGRSGYVLLGHVINKQGDFPKITFKLEHVKIFYIASSQNELKKIGLNIANHYNIKNPTVGQPGLSGIISLPDSFRFYWQEGSLQPEF